MSNHKNFVYLVGLYIYMYGKTMYGTYNFKLRITIVLLYTELMFSCHLPLGLQAVSFQHITW